MGARDHLLQSGLRVALALRLLRAPSLSDLYRFLLMGPPSPGSRASLAPLLCSLEDEADDADVDGTGQKYKTIAELKQEEAQRRAGTGLYTLKGPMQLNSGVCTPSMRCHVPLRCAMGFTGDPVRAVRMNQDPAAVDLQSASQGKAEDAEAEDEDAAAERRTWSQERCIAEDMVEALVEEWRTPM